VTELRRETIVPLPLDETFAFFADAGNLERLTPPWLNFRILTPRPIAMGEGALIDYRIVLYGVPIAWRTRIDVWEPGVRFVDRQLWGPYAWWHHEHRFAAVPGGTQVSDHVEYVPRMRWVSSGLVRRDVERIFSYRQEILPALLRAAATPSR
jgi:ligand-binding SRPBCC domain-containing protein